MAFLDRLKPLFEPPVVEVPVYECENCGVTVETDTGTCPDCGGTIAGDTREIPVHWGGLD